MSTESTQRFLALDVFRGMTVCFMIIVNTSGNWGTTFAPLLHAQWNGFTPTDLVFPSFLFAVGNAMSFVQIKWASQSSREVVWKILKRTFLIFLIGFLGYWFPFFKLDENYEIIAFPFHDTRVFGVLQRIALCYGTVALLLFFFKPLKTMIITTLALLVYGLVYWNYSEVSMANNPVLDLDIWLLGESHLYKGEGIPFDPEGLLSTLPALFNVAMGFWVGDFLQRKGKTYEGLAKLLLLGVFLVAVGFLWNYSFPINKKLWTSSFSVLTVGLDCCLLAAVCYYTDFKMATRGIYFFQVFGKNPLVIYLFSELLVIPLYMIPLEDTNLYSWIYQNGFQWVGDYTGALFFALTFMLLCWTLGYIMDRKKVYVRL
ncbi:acyltransferase family protein [Flavobacterium stagni]|uniref:DUF5009 domain-containing protein n=1 Tax=Flavobacterium stagni TaxID=2506421 RepID=A0A4Q1KAT1_9FLAO|nr:DUF5009 domain-containing protein [Flavobacterium stagni]RXR23395.1 DUF5009 domain-containing protein [Flavobacterium stagni]